MGWGGRCVGTARWWRRQRSGHLPRDGDRDTLVGEMPLAGPGDEDGRMTQDDGTSRPDPGTNAEGEGPVRTYRSGGVHPLSGGWHLKEPVELTFPEGRWQIRLPSVRPSALAAAW